MNISFILIIVGLLLGVIWQLKTIKKPPTKIWDLLSKTCFEWLLPFVVLVEVSSMNLTEWWLFIYGSAFVFIYYALGMIITKDKHKASLLATAEGGTIGFMFYNSMRVEALSRFFVIDMLGNGGTLFSFIYWKISGVFKFWDFAFKNRLMLAMWLAVIINLIAKSEESMLHLKNFSVIADIASLFGLLLTLLIATIVGTEIKFHISRKIFFSKFFWQFWCLRLLGMIRSIYLELPFALTILFILPPSFLLQVIYNKSQKKEKEYAANFIAACLPITFLIFFIMKIFY